MCVTSEAVRRCLVLSCSRRRGQALVGPNESSLSTGALASRASPCTHGRLSRLLGRPIHARRAGDAVRCVRVAQELRAATRAASVRAQHGVQKVGEASTTPWRAAPTERGPTERGPTWTASSGRLSRGRGRAVAADCRRPSRRASDMPPARGREEGADCGSGSVALVVLSRRVCVGTFISLPRTRVERVAGNALLRALRRQSAGGPSAGVSAPSAEEAWPESLALGGTPAPRKCVQCVRTHTVRVPKWNHGASRSH